MSSSASSAPQCHNCRKRRIRCDSALPTCKKCARKGIDCPGYGKKKPLVWLEGGGYQNQHLTEGNKPSSERKPRKSGRPRIVVAKDDDQKMTIGTLIRANPTAHGLRPIIRGVPETLDVKYPMETKLVVGSLWYCKWPHFTINIHTTHPGGEKIFKCVMRLPVRIRKGVR